MKRKKKGIRSWLGFLGIRNFFDIRMKFMGDIWG